MGKEIDFLKSLGKKELLSVIESLQEKHSIDSDEIKKIIDKGRKIEIPSFVFVKELSALESICKYLKENLELCYHEIATLLKRDDRTIWTTYNNSVKKRKRPFVKKKIEFTIPLNLFENRKLSILENIVKYLKEEHEFSYKQIGLFLKRNERTIWTVYNRVKKKLLEKASAKKTKK